MNLTTTVFMYIFQNAILYFGYTNRLRLRCIFDQQYFMLIFFAAKHVF